MLPVELSTDQCSLRPHEDRLVLSALLEIDAHGDVVAQEFSRGVIRSAERMTYTAVHGVLEGDAALRERYAKLIGPVRADAGAGADPEPQARAARLHRFRSAGAAARIRRIRRDDRRRRARRATSRTG